LAVAEDIANRLQGSWAEAEAEASGPQARLKALISAQLTAIAQTPALPSILFSRELQVDNPALRDVFRKLLSAFQGRLVAVVHDLQAAGEMKRHVNPEDVAILLTSLVQGVAIRWTLGARGFALVPEGLLLFDVQMELLSAKEDACDA